MVGRWGMSDSVGPISVLPRPEDEAMQLPGFGDGTVSQATRELVDSEVRRIVEECYRRALDALRENRSRLDALARALLERETLDEQEAYGVAGFERRPGDEDRDGAPAPTTASTHRQGGPAR
jgi:cell division protease FtsH